MKIIIEINMSDDIWEDAPSLELERILLELASGTHGAGVEEMEGYQIMDRNGDVCGSVRFQTRGEGSDYPDERLATGDDPDELEEDDT